MSQSEITNPHAMFFEKVFSRTDVISDIIQYYLPQSIVQALDISTIQLEPGSFITNDLKPTQSDLLFKVQTRDHLSIMLYFLFEHKSDMDRWIMLQLLGYIVQICHKQRAENKQQRQEKREENKLSNRPENEGIKTEYLYPIIPVVFYHGKTRWKVTDFRRYSRETLILNISQILHMSLSIWQTTRMNILKEMSSLGWH